MIIKIVIESIHSLIHKTRDAPYLSFNDLVTVPIVNLDSYSLITKSYGTSKWEEVSMKKKNMNKKYCGDNLLSSGVDLNRNYGFHFAESQETLD